MKAHGVVRNRRLRQPKVRGVPVGPHAAANPVRQVGDDRAVPVAAGASAPVPALDQGTPAAPQSGHARRDTADAPVAHGTHAGYRAGCRCHACGLAQQRYRQGDCRRAPRQDATAARAHLDQLAAHGIGLTQAARLSGLPRTTLQHIRNGDWAEVSAALEATVLAIPGAPALGALTRAWRTRRLLAWFRREGFSDAEVARRLGFRWPKLQFDSPCCTFRSAARVRALYRKVAQI